MHKPGRGSALPRLWVIFVLANRHERQSYKCVLLASDHDEQTIVLNVCVCLVTGPDWSSQVEVWFRRRYLWVARSFWHCQHEFQHLSQVWAMIRNPGETCLGHGKL